MATRMWTPAASALRRQPARSRFGDTIHTQNGNATRKFSSESEAARALLEECKERRESNKEIQEALKNSQIHEVDFELGHFSHCSCYGCGTGY
ncbi:unnamed protein product [Urochloa decumbens]|uniref:Uncharacterized protein n=1 Tax=Urochloa decumbens TaxID=240449 RepID=A0ABC8VVT0_9POAL